MGDREKCAITVNYLGRILFGIGNAGSEMQDMGIGI